MDMESHLYVNELASLVKEGKVDPALIDDAATRILKVKFELGLFDDPYKYCDEAREASVIGSQSNLNEVLRSCQKIYSFIKKPKQPFTTGQKRKKHSCYRCTCLR